jgi:hypothetical protein
MNAECSLVQRLLLAVIARGVVARSLGSSCAYRRGDRSLLDLRPSPPYAPVGGPCVALDARSGDLLLLSSIGGGLLDRRRGGDRSRSRGADAGTVTSRPWSRPSLSARGSRLSRPESRVERSRERERERSRRSRCGEGVRRRSRGASYEAEVDGAR